MSIKVLMPLVDNKLPVLRVEGANLNLILDIGAARNFTKLTQFIYAKHPSPAAKP